MKFLCRFMPRGFSNFLVLYGSSSMNSWVSTLLLLGFSIENVLIIFWQFFKAVVRLLIYLSIFFLIYYSLNLVIELTTLFYFIMYTLSMLFFLGWLYTGASSSSSFLIFWVWIFCSLSVFYALEIKSYLAVKQDIWSLGSSIFLSSRLTCSLIFK